MGICELDTINQEGAHKCSFLLSVCIQDANKAHSQLTDVLLHKGWSKSSEAPYCVCSILQEMPSAVNKVQQAPFMQSFLEIIHGGWKFQEVLNLNYPHSHKNTYLYSIRCLCASACKQFNQWLYRPYHMVQVLVAFINYKSTDIQAFVMVYNATY